MTEITTGRQLQADLHQQLSDALWTDPWDWLTSQFQDHRHNFWAQSHATHRTLRNQHEIKDLRNPEIPVKGVATAVVLSLGAFGVLVFCSKKVQKTTGSDRIFWQRCSMASVVVASVTWLGSSAYVTVVFDSEENIQHFCRTSNRIVRNSQKHLRDYDALKDTVIKECPHLKDVVTKVWLYERSNFRMAFDVLTPADDEGDVRNAAGLSAACVKKLNAHIERHYATIQQNIRAELRKPNLQFKKDRTPLKAIIFALKTAHRGRDHADNAKNESRKRVNCWYHGCKQIDGWMQEIQSSNIGTIIITNRTIKGDIVGWPAVSIHQLRRPGILEQLTGMQPPDKNLAFSA